MSIKTSLNSTESADADSKDVSSSPHGCSSLQQPFLWEEKREARKKRRSKILAIVLCNCLGRYMLENNQL